MPGLAHAAARLLQKSGDGGRVLRFAAVGLASTLLYAAGATALTHGPDPLLGAAAGSFLAYSCCAVFSYLGHKLFTFGSGGAHGAEAPRFLLLTGFGLAFSFAVPALLSGCLGFAPVVSVLVTTVAVPLLNYLVLSSWVFAPARPGAAP